MSSSTHPSIPDDGLVYSYTSSTGRADDELVELDTDDDELDFDTDVEDIFDDGYDEPSPLPPWSAEQTAE